jgi:16S rRNA (guanine(527)-N(7))-methyltransferase RsmG
MRSELVSSIRSHQAVFGLDLTDIQIGRLADYHELVLEHNPLLHLVGPCSTEEFAIRHILESLATLDYLPERARFADVGAGAGLPSIPCLLVRKDLKATLIESNLKKAGFLRMVLAKCELGDRARVFDRQFSELKDPGVSHVTCRALDKFTAKLPQLLRWSDNCTLILFGGNSLRDALLTTRVAFTEKLLPMSEQRFVFHVGGA